MSNRVSATPKKLMDDAVHTTNHYLENAVKRIDDQFGEGYAKKNPTLVAAFIQSCAKDFDTAFIGQGQDNIAMSIESLSSTIEHLYNIAETNKI